MRRSLSVVVSTVTLALMWALPAPAEDVQAPQSVDVAGDANGVNNQGRTEVPQIGNISTAPASIDGADLREIWFETLYSIVKDRDDTGRVVAVRHVPDRLRVNVRTTGPAKPTFGPGVIIRVAATLDGSCEMYFQVYIAGTAPGSTLERTEMNRIRNCSGGTLTGFTHTFQGAVTSMTFPFASTFGELADGVTIGPWGHPHTRIVTQASTASATPFALDEAPLLQPFVIGSDVPPDVDCLAEPSPLCE